jgi:hypothetical protein
MFRIKSKTFDEVRGVYIVVEERISDKTKQVLKSATYVIPVSEYCINRLQQEHAKIFKSDDSKTK